MFQRILVPLDGSERAEPALSVAETIAQATGGSLVLMRVVPSPRDTTFSMMEPVSLVQEEPASAYQAATDYLAHQRCMLERKGRVVRTNVLVGMPAQHILSSIETEAIDLVIMCSRGETGLKRWVMGSVAQKVLRYSQAPVLILHESAGQLSNQHPAGRQPVRVLVALDGSSLAEEALQPALALSSVLSAPEKGQVHLVRVLPLLKPDHAPEQQKAAFQLDIAAAQAYLHMVETSLLDSAPDGMAYTHQASVVGEKDIASGIIRVAEDGVPARDGHAARHACDVIALTTHGRSGLERWVMGSIAERLLDGTRLPLLVIPASWTSECDRQETKEKSYARP